MRILLANEARAGGGGVESYLAALVPLLQGRGHAVALLHDNSSAEAGPTEIPAAEHWSVSDEGLDRAGAAARGWRPDVCYSHNMRRLAVDELLAGVAPLVKMMHGYFGTCVSGQKAFSASMESCHRTCGPACLLYYVPRRCGRLRPAAIVRQYQWAARQRRLFPRYAGLVVASEHMRGEYLRHDVPPAKVHTIPLFAPAVPRGNPAAGGIDVDVAFLGRMTPLKGGDALVRAAAMAGREVGRPLSLVLAGAGPERARLEALAAQLGVRAAFPGWIDGAERERLLRRTRMLAIPSIWPEPFGLAGLEAAAAGVPSVAFETGGIGQWLEPGVNGLLVPPGQSAAGLARAIAAIVAQPDLHARLSAGALAAAARLSADAHAAALERVLDGAR